MAITANQISDHITKLRQTATELMDNVKELDALRRDWDAMAISGHLTADNCQGFTPAEIAAVYTSHAAINTLLAQGHATNLLTVRVG